MIFPVNILIITAGFYLAFRVSLHGALFTGLGVGFSLGLLASLAQSDPEFGILAIFASHILGAIPIYLLANRYDGILAFWIIVPIGFVLLLVGGPIEWLMLFME